MLFECLLKWRQEVDKQVTDFQFSDQRKVDAALGDWLESIRQTTCVISMPVCKCRVLVMDLFMAGSRLYIAYS